MTESVTTGIISRALRLRELDLRLSVTKAELRGAELGIDTDIAVRVAEFLAGRLGTAAGAIDGHLAGSPGQPATAQAADIAALLADQLRALSEVEGLKRVPGDALAIYLSQEFGALADEIGNLAARARTE